MYNLGEYMLNNTILIRFTYSYNPIPFGYSRCEDPSENNLGISQFEVFTRLIGCSSYAYLDLSNSPIFVS